MNRQSARGVIYRYVQNHEKKNLILVHDFLVLVNLAIKEKDQIGPAQSSFLYSLIEAYMNHPERIPTDELDRIQEALKIATWVNSVTE